MSLYEPGCVCVLSCLCLSVFFLFIMRLPTYAASFQPPCLIVQLCSADIMCYLINSCISLVLWCKLIEPGVDFACFSIWTACTGCWHIEADDMYLLWGGGGRGLARLGFMLVPLSRGLGYRWNLAKNEQGDLERYIHNRLKPAAQRWEMLRYWSDRSKRRGK